MSNPQLISIFFPGKKGSVGFCCLSVTFGNFRAICGSKMCRVHGGPHARSQTSQCSAALLCPVSLSIGGETSCKRISTTLQSQAAFTLCQGRNSLFQLRKKAAAPIIWGRPAIEGQCNFIAPAIGVALSCLQQQKG